MDKLFGLEMSTIAGSLGATLILVLIVLAVLGWRSNVMLKLGLRPILRRKTQSGLIVLGLMLATLIITAAFVTGDTLSHTIRSLVLEELGPLDEIVRVRSDGASGSPQSAYFSVMRQEELSADLGNYPLVDAVVPALRESVPAVNLTRRQSVRALEITGVRPEEASFVLPMEEQFDAQGTLLPLDALGSRELYLNQEAAESLLAEPGDTLKLYVGSTPKQFIVRGVGAAGRSP